MPTAFHFKVEIVGHNVQLELINVLLEELNMKVSELIAQLAPLGAQLEAIKNEIMQKIDALAAADPDLSVAGAEALNAIKKAVQGLEDVVPGPSVPPPVEPVVQEEAKKPEAVKTAEVKEELHKRGH